MVFLSVPCRQGLVLGLKIFWSSVLVPNSQSTCLACGQGAHPTVLLTNLPNCFVSILRPNSTSQWTVCDQLYAVNNDSTLRSSKPHLFIYCTVKLILTRPGTIPGSVEYACKTIKAGVSILWLVSGQEQRLLFALISLFICHLLFHWLSHYHDISWLQLWPLPAPKTNLWPLDEL